jgi:DNA relaxase NicK
MTKKDYILIASAISDSMNTWNIDNAKRERAGTKDVALTIAERLEKDNSQFKKEKFLAACGIVPSDK